MDEGPDKSKHPWLFYGWLTVIVFSVLLVLVTLPKIRDALHDSNMVTVVSSYLEQTESQDKQAKEFSVFYPIPQETNGKFTYASYPRVAENGTSRHELIENLLVGPSAEALADGAITFIPPNTRLIGLTVSNRIAFVDFSKEFLAPTVWEGASPVLRFEQVRQNLVTDSDIRDVVLLVEGSLLELDQ